MTEPVVLKLNVRLEDLLQEAHKNWSSTKWPTVLSAMDKYAPNILNQPSKKHLAEATRDFLKLTPTEREGQLKGLLKAYQTEIDNLASRLKDCEGVFLEMYSLVEAPDPHPIISQFIAKMEEMNQIIGENQDLRLEVVSLQKQLKETKQPEPKQTPVDLEHVKLLQDRNRDLENQLKSSAEKIRALTVQLEKPPVESNTKALETEIDGLRGQLEASEREVERLRRELVSRPEQKDSGYLQVIEEKDAEIDRLETRVEQLNSQFQQIQTKLSDESVLNSQLKMLNSENAALKEQLHQRQDYDQMKGELDAFRSIDFNEEERRSNLPLEAMALMKSRRLQDELVQLRNDHSASVEEVKRLVSDLKVKEIELEQSKNLVKNLEKDLLRMNGRETPDLLRSDRDESLLPIVSSQRDRFHERSIELEQLSAQKQNEINDLRSQIESLKEDNVKLYQKIKFIKSYQQQKQINISIPDDQKYSDMYESRIDPFQQFIRKENTRKLRNLNPADRFALQLSRFIAGNAYVRLVVLLYLLALHFLVFGVLMKFSVWEECRHDHDVNFWREHLSQNDRQELEKLLNSH